MKIMLANRIAPDRMPHFAILLSHKKVARLIYGLSSVYTITYWLSVRLPYEDILHSLTYAGIR